MRQYLGIRIISDLGQDQSGAVTVSKYSTLHSRVSIDER